METALSQLAYWSQKLDLGEVGITGLLKQSRARNVTDDLTGALLFNQDHFLQCLEGNRRQVTAAFCRIAVDQRHTNVTLVSVRDIEERDFPDQTMGYVVSTSPELSTVLSELGLSPARGRDPVDEQASAKRAAWTARGAYCRPDRVPTTRAVLAWHLDSEETNSVVQRIRRVSQGVASVCTCHRLSPCPLGTECRSSWSGRS